MYESNIKLETLKTEFIQAVSDYCTIIKQVIDVPALPILPIIDIDFDTLREKFQNVSYVDDIEPLKELLRVVYAIFAKTNALVSSMRDTISLLFTDAIIRKLRSQVTVTTYEMAYNNSRDAIAMSDGLEAEMFNLKHYYWPILHKDIHKAKLEFSQVRDLIITYHTQYNVSDLTAYILAQYGVSEPEIYTTLNNFGIRTVPVEPINFGIPIKFKINAVIDNAVATMMGLNDVSTSQGINGRTIEKFNTTAREDIKYADLLDPSEFAIHIAIGQIMNSELARKLADSDALPVSPSALLARTEIENKNERHIRAQVGDYQTRKLYNMGHRTMNDHLLANVVELVDMYDLMRIAELENAEATSMKKKESRERIVRYIAGNKHFTRAIKMPHQILIDLL